MPERHSEFHGAGLGLRRALLGPLLSMDQGAVDFMEVAPENWIGVGGRFGRQFRQLAERYPRYGYPTLHAMLRTEGLVQNPKRTYQIYREEGLQVRR